MTSLSHLKHSASVAIIAASFVAGYPTLVSAHSYSACCDDVYDFCRSVHGYTPAGDACVASGTSQCLFHSHPGGRVPDPPDPNMRANPGHQLNYSPTLRSR